MQGVRSCRAVARRAKRACVRVRSRACARFSRRRDPVGLWAGQARTHALRRPWQESGEPANERARAGGRARGRAGASGRAGAQARRCVCGAPKT